MYKIAILGCENSHAKNFLELISTGNYPEIEVVGIYSNELEAVQKLHDQYGVRIMEDYAELRGKVDGIMITARHGDNHYKYAKPYIDDGIPMFIDKPITCSEEDAIEFMRVAKDKGIRLCGGSTCAALKETLDLAEAVREKSCGDIRGGSLACPIQLSSPYGGFYFYAQHLVEIMTTIFGRSLTQIHADRRDKEVTFTARYDSFNVNATFIDGIGYYTASVYGSKESRSEILRFTPQSFRHEMNDMLDLLNGKEMKQSYESFITPVFIINAIMRSMESGKWEDINEIKI
ncbi:MAG: Gfo/Idh/MocA family oxidoreductase [Clostridia bacterium]|nr:Gfo/Idh/MocA family oxidoreductase [Clostridia bacterium]